MVFHEMTILDKHVVIDKKIHLNKVSSTEYFRVFGYHEPSVYPLPQGDNQSAPARARGRGGGDAPLSVPAGAERQEAGQEQEGGTQIPVPDLK